ncbi:hypothetical protein [Burkholderia gladioli]|uniref:hypothetical protein n=1 Tax=Burkholderia gladioli TaxID=28095 RepID=UPI001FC80844|nr:hypothetical protein [Burkholderia gladioli]
MRVDLTLRIAPKRPGGRGEKAAKRVHERVERDLLARYRRTPTRDDQTALQVAFASTDLFDREIDDLLAAVALEAERQNCASDSEARAWVDGEKWLPEKRYSSRLLGKTSWQTIFLQTKRLHTIGENL